jgi:RHS repeat-associated protein
VGGEPTWFTEEDSRAVPNVLGFVEGEVSERRGATTPIVRTQTEREPFLASGAYLYGMAQRELVTDIDVTTGRTGTRTMAYEWSELGGVDAVVREPGAGASDPEHVFLRVETTTDAYGQPLQITMRDAEAMAAGGDLEHHVRVTSLTYDELDGTHLRSVTNTLGQLQWVGVHPTFGVPLLGTDPNGITGYFRYDGFGRVRETRAPGGATTTYDYRHTAGRDILTMTDAGGGRSETRLDSLSRPQQFTHRMLGGDFGSAMTYDVLGRAVEASIPRLSTATGPRVSARRESDIFGRPTRTSFVQRAVGGGITQTVTRWGGSYEVGGTTATFTDTDSVRFAEADHHGRVVRSGDRRGGVEEERSHTYGAFDLPASSLDVIGAATTMEYDAIGRPTGVTDADRGLQTIAYNAFGEVTSITDALGVTSFDRDDLGRKLHEHRTEGEVTTTVASFFWDTAVNGIGRIDYAAVPSTGDTIAYRYDVVGRVQRETRTIAGEVFETDMSYDSVGRLRRVQYPRANGRRFSVFYRYDAGSGALTRVESCAAGCAGGAGAREGEVLWELRQVDGLGRPLEDVRGGMTTTRTYDELRGTLQSLTTRSATSTALQQWIYVADDEGRFAARGEAVSPRIELFGYDRFDRLQTWNVFTGPGFLRLRRSDTFGYEPQGGGRFDLVTSQNLRDGTTTQESYAYPEVSEGRPHAATEVTRSVGSTSLVEGYGYDDRGRQVTGPGRTIDYTHFDLPWRVTTAAGTTTFEYDAFHQRTRSIRPEGVVTHVGELYERRQNGQIGQHVFYVHTPVGLVAQVEEEEGSGARTTKYFHDDGLRSVSLVTNPTGSTVHGRQWFGPFGQRLALDGTDAPPETTTVIRGFTEHRQEDALGLIDMRGRFYDPRLRQFLTPDPLQADPLSSQGTNPYSYVMNRPPNAWDPSGFEVCHELPGGFSCVEAEPPAMPALDRMDSILSSAREQVLLAQAVTPGEMTVMSDTAPSLGGEAVQAGPVEYARQLFSRLAPDGLENIGGGFADEIWNHGRMMVAIGFVLTLLENTPVVNWFTTPGLLGLLYFQIRDNWDQLTAMAVRFVHGESTPQDQRAFGAFIAQMFAAAFGSRVGRAAVGTALPFGVGAVVAWATGGSSRGSASHPDHAACISSDRCVSAS